MINIFGPNRQSIRIKHFDYASEGMYYVTLVAQDRIEIFGEVKEGVMHLSAIGKMVNQAWKNIPQYGPGIGLDEFIVMPNHLHGIISMGWNRLELNGGQARRPAPTMTWDIDMVGAGFHPRPRLHPIPSRQSIPDIIQKFKSWTTYQFQTGVKRKMIKPLQQRLWQRNYYEHIVRDQEDLNRIRKYIQDNPGNWKFDPENEDSDKK